VRILEQHGREEIPVHLLYPGTHPPPKLRAFIDFAVPQLRARLAAIEHTLGA
jgi:DNA-binding transcriptional LysR family regulator